MEKINEKTKAELKLHKKELVVWAIKCARRVLPYFEKKYSQDKRPRKALETAKAWLKNKPKIKLQEIRKASLDSHAAARKAKDLPARFAARACGQAVATGHSSLHAIGAAYYARKTVGLKKVENERKWQKNQIPKHLKKYSTEMLKY